MLLIAWAMLMVNLAPPLAAIALIPKSGWWPVERARISEQTHEERAVAINRLFVANSTELWPTHFTAELLPGSSCVTSNATLNESCPAGGYSIISETMPNWNALSLET